MIVEYCFSHPDGDIPLNSSLARRPLKISPAKEHPFLTLGDYFDSVYKFLSRDKGLALCEAIAMVSGNNITFSSIQKILIRSEKHGGLYQVAGMEIETENTSAKFAVNTALSREQAEWLKNEFNVITLLNEKTALPYLPVAYLIGDIDCGATSVTMALMEWFEDYHEWHFTLDRRDSKPKVRLWDQKRGNRFLSKQESREIFRQASKILACYYDFETYRRIRPWSNSAGDFIVSEKDGRIEVRLITARKYEPFIEFLLKEDINPVADLLYFFLDLTLRMRLDRLDGTGKPVMADTSFLGAIVRGFLEGLGMERKEKDHPAISAHDLIHLLKGFNREDFQKTVFAPDGII